MTFGYLKRKREPLDELAQEFVEFLKKQLAGPMGTEFNGSLEPENSVPTGLPIDPRPRQRSVEYED